MPRRTTTTGTGKAPRRNYIEEKKAVPANDPIRLYLDPADIEWLDKQTEQGINYSASVRGLIKLERERDAKLQGYTPFEFFSFWAKTNVGMDEPLTARHLRQFFRSLKSSDPEVKA